VPIWHLADAVYVFKEKTNNLEAFEMTDNAILILDEDVIRGMVCGARFEKAK